MDKFDKAICDLFSAACPECVSLEINDLLRMKFQNIISEEIDEWKFRRHLEAALANDEALDTFVERYCRRRYDRSDGRVVIEQYVRAQVYGGDDHHLYHQEYRVHFNTGHDPRRPVRLRGSFFCVTNKWSHQNDWPHEVARRFLRRSRYTCLDQEEHWDNMAELSQRLAGKYRVTRTFCEHLRNNYDSCVGKHGSHWYAWVGGIHFGGFSAPPLVLKCVMCRRAFFPERKRKTCSNRCERERRVVNARRKASALVAFKQMGLIRQEDFL